MSTAQKRGALLRYFLISASVLFLGFAADLADRAGPIFEMVGLHDPAFLHLVDVDRHDLEAGLGVDAEEFTGRRAGGLAAADIAVALLQDLLWMPFQVRYSGPEEA